MNKRIEQKFRAEEKEMTALENSLSGALVPVHPPNNMMQRLRKKIGTLEPNRIAKRISNWELSIITVGSLMSVAVAILTIIRAFFYFFGKHKKSMA